ncbi:hypothetical protein G9A89_016022 [Geosiphon pyriformis]|nr:hypothetical protein G9A89_016022 [Geosiphon pyriformis]
MQRSTSIEITDYKVQVKRSKTFTTEKKENNTTLQNTTTVEATRPTTPPFKFETVNRPFKSVNTSSEDNTPFKIANTSKRTAPHRQAVDFSSTMANRLEKKTNKKYRHIGRISVKDLTKRFNQVIKEDSPKNIILQTDNFVLQPMFNKGKNSNKFQIETGTSKKGASKSLKKMDRPSKATKRNSERAVQIEAALRKYNPDILNRINNGNSVMEIEKQRDNSFSQMKIRPIWMTMQRT